MTWFNFLDLNTECFEYLPKSRTSNGLRHQSRRGNYSTINGLVFIKSFEKDYTARTEHTHYY